MNKVKSHWLVFAGILLGIIVGSIINAQHIDEVRHTVLGQNYVEADLHANAKQLNDALVVSVKNSPLGATLDGLGRVFLNLLKMVVIPLVFFSIVCGICSMGGGSALARARRPIRWESGPFR